MSCMPKIADYFKFLDDEEAKDFAVIYFGDCCKSRSKALYSKLGKEENLRKIA